MIQTENGLPTNGFGHDRRWLSTPEASLESMKLFEPHLPYYKKPFFMYFLKHEAARAERYNSFFSLLLLQVQGDSPYSQPELDYLTFLLGNHVRGTDHLGTLGRGALAVILLNASREGSLIVLERLTADLGLNASSELREKLRLSFAVYPTEANSAEALHALAWDRLPDPR